MNETPPFTSDDADLWTIPLHGISVPLPPTADVPPLTQTADEPKLDFLADDVPTDLGYHPRLRRSA